MKVVLRLNRAVIAIVTLCFALLLAASLRSATVEPALAAAPSAVAEPDAAKNNKLYLPLLADDHNALLATRIGFGSGISVSQIPSVDTLNAGWYVNWNVSANPPRPGGMEYVQMVRVHQLRTCGSRVSEDEIKCPYVQPYAYELGYGGTLNKSTVTDIATRNPGSTWLFGNECDRRDWDGGGQDEILPEVYIDAYHQLYGWVKGADPTAKTAICGVIQATPLRLQYLTKIWDLYKQKYGEMPVDVWNVHNFIMQEDGNSWGARIPPGIDAKNGAYVGQHHLHIDMGVFDDQIRAFRQWMKERGQQNKPLIVTEYGVLYKSYQNGQPFTEEMVHTFMLDTFDYFATEKDCNLSSTDSCRLVQRWAWFSLEDIGWDFNPHGALFNKNSKRILPAGEKYRNHVLNNMEALNNYHP